MSNIINRENYTIADLQRVHDRQNLRKLNKVKRVLRKYTDKYYMKLALDKFNSVNEWSEVKIHLDDVNHDLLDLLIIKKDGSWKDKSCYDRIKELQKDMNTDLDYITKNHNVYMGYEPVTLEEYRRDRYHRMIGVRVR